MKNFQGPKFGIVALILQIIFLLIYGFCFKYKDNIDATKYNRSITRIDETRYFYFQDVQGMMFLGFGFLMVFLQKYGYGSIGFNFLLSVLTIEWALVMNGVREVQNGKIQIDVSDLLKAEFTVTAVLISLGAVLGKLSPLQYLLMALMEIPIISGNEYLGRKVYMAVDTGNTIYMHTFGAYFGLACATIISLMLDKQRVNEDTRYDSDLFSMIGTLALWIFWPSFNAGDASGDAQQRAIVNTVISLCGSTFMTFIINSFITTDDSDGESIRGKFKMTYIQNATLAGGVGVGACADMMIEPWGALLIGTVVGAVSTLGFHYLTPLLTRIYIHDTCGVHNLHGMPGIIGGIGSSVAASIATVERYGSNFNLQGRSPSSQAGYQLAALVTTIAIAISGGIAVGLILRFISLCDKPEKEDLYRENRFWILPMNSKPEINQGFSANMQNLPNENERNGY